jgi:nucleoside-diphosphate-sugar epimerase
MPGRPDQDADHQLRLLEDAWDNVLQHWHDDVAVHFAAHHWAPLQQESRFYLEALRKLMDVLSAAERETSW